MQRGRLALSRRPGEAVVINGNVVVRVFKVVGDVVRFTVEAPKDIPVVREELLDREEETR